MINSSETQMLTTEMKRAEIIVSVCCQVIDQKAHDNNLNFIFDHHSLGYSMVYFLTIFNCELLF